MPAWSEVEFPPLLSEPLSPEWDLGAAAQHTVLYHFREMLKQRSVVWRNEELEGVHQIRVAARRTRTALQTLRVLWEGPELRRFEQYLVKFATAFGVARDLDVMIIYFDELIAQADPDRAAAYRWLLERNRQRRQEEQPHLERILLKMEEEAFPAAFVTYFSHVPVDLWALGVKHG